MADSPKSVDTRTIDSYCQSCLAICAQRLGGYSDLAAVAAEEDRLNAYPRLDRLEEPRGVTTLDPEALDQGSRDRALACLLEGRFLAEHAAAGEATRLKMGTKYLINPGRRLSLESMAQAWNEAGGAEASPETIREKTGGAAPEDLLDLTLGSRHMLQMAFDLTDLARENGRSDSTVLESQRMLIILNQASAEEVVESTARDNFFGFRPELVMFMVQESFPGIGLKEGRFFFDPNSPRRLHNHGQMAMQQTAREQIFFLEGGNPERRRYLSPEEYLAILEGMEDKLSYNIEDLDYLGGALDLAALALALRLSDQGARMVMEIVANNPVHPVKGGLAAWDSELKRNVMIESFQLLDMPNSELKFLNRNFNHYPRPAAAFQALAQGLPMPIAVKGGLLYFQPVQGDLNFSLPTAFVQRKVLKPLRSWKSALDTPTAVAAMSAQDNQDGFKEFCQEVLQRKL